MAGKMTLKNTKQEILDALTEAEKKLKERNAIMASPATKQDKAAAQAAVQIAEKDVADGIFSDELKSKFENLQSAIAIQEERLKTCYGVEKALIDMTTVINAAKQAQMDCQAELEAAKAASQAELRRLDEQETQAKLDVALARTREQAEYDYDLKRQRKQEADAYADQQAELAKKITVAEARLTELNANAEEIIAMKNRLANIQIELDAKYAEGVDAGKREAGKEYGYRTSMAEKDHGYELRERDSRIALLETDVNAKDAKIASLEEKLDAAYSQLRELATKTVESSGGVKVLNAGGDISGKK